jgi:hypothetical protein
MAIVVKRAIAFSSGNNNVASSFAGDVIPVEFAPFSINTKYALRVRGASASFKVKCDQSDRNVVSFKFHITSSPVSDSTILIANNEVDIISSFELILKNDGELEVLGLSGISYGTTSGLNLSLDTDYKIVIDFDNLVGISQQLRLWVDGNLELDVNGIWRSSDLIDTFEFLFSGSLGINTYYISELFIGDNSLDISSVNPDGYEIFEFAIAGTGYSEDGDVDNPFGHLIDFGSWANTGEQPSSDLTVAGIQGAGVSQSIFSSAVSNGSLLSGPIGLDFGSKISVGYECNYRVERTSGVFDSRVTVSVIDLPATTIIASANNFSLFDESFTNDFIVGDFSSAIDPDIRVPDSGFHFRFQVGSFTPAIDSISASSIFFLLVLEEPISGIINDTGDVISQVLSVSLNNPSVIVSTESTIVGQELNIKSNEIEARGEFVLWSDRRKSVDDGWVERDKQL